MQRCKYFFYIIHPVVLRMIHKPINHHQSIDDLLVYVFIKFSISACLHITTTRTTKYFFIRFKIKEFYCSLSIVCLLVKWHKNDWRLVCGAVHVLLSASEGQMSEMQYLRRLNILNKSRREKINTVWCPAQCSVRKKSLFTVCELLLTCLTQRP